ncbi:MAG: transposase, partial [Verrucomicrobia bacterium]|nr:transposase [Verrucomicrobiota bacterium]
TRRHPPGRAHRTHRSPLGPCQRLQSQNRRYPHAPIIFRIPQVRDGIAFYPAVLDKCLRSGRALRLAMAEMYVQGVG